MKGSVIIIILVFITACNNSEAPQEKPVRHVYLYYPKPNVYLDTLQKQFTYFDSASKQWVTANPPASVLSDLGRSVLIDSAAQPVWSANEKHRMIYAATLYADSSDFKEPPKVVENKPEKKKKPQPDEPEAPKEKKKLRLGDLINKIFNRKDKDKKEN